MAKAAMSSSMAMAVMLALSMFLWTEDIDARATGTRPQDLSAEQRSALKTSKRHMQYAQ